MKNLSLNSVRVSLLALVLGSLLVFSSQSFAFNFNIKKCPALSLSSPPASLDRCNPNTLTLTSAGKDCGPWTYHFTWNGVGSCSAGSYNITTSSNPLVFSFPSGIKPCVGSTVSCWISDTAGSSSAVYNFSVTSTCH